MKWKHCFKYACASSSSSYRGRVWTRPDFVGHNGPIIPYVSSPSNHPSTSSLALALQGKQVLRMCVVITILNDVYLLLRSRQGIYQQHWEVLLSVGIDTCPQDRGFNVGENFFSPSESMPVFSRRRQQGIQRWRKFLLAVGIDPCLLRFRGVFACASLT